MAETLGASFTIDVSNLSAGLKQANKMIRESESEFKAAAAGMDNWSQSEEGLKAKIKSLSDTTQIQREKVRALKEEYSRLIDEGMDPTSQQAVDLRTKINNEEAALKSNEKELQRQTQALEELGEESEETGGKFEKFGDVMKKVGAVAAAALAAAGAAAIALGKASIESYAEYEQLVGGVETLFGKSADEVQKYAANAYKTAGLSANQYMEQATSFSASLIQSLGGDTAAAAEYANRAIVDMSDNANKMGTDIESIQNAYQGFAKQNYTMLDNLKLGYGGTKEEMQRLIDDANKLKVAQGEVGDLTIESYSDIIDAIHLVQDEMGITGTTAAEASETISGSIGMMKGAWANLLTGLADENANIEQLISNLIDSVMTVLDNLIPRVQQVIKGIVQMIEQMTPEIPAILNALLPEVVAAAMALLQGIVTALPMIVQAIADVLPLILQAILSMLPSIVESAIQIIISVIDSITTMVPTIVEAVMELLPLLVKSLLKSVPELLKAAITLLTAIIQAIPTIVLGLQADFPQIINTILNTLIKSIPVILQGAIQLLTAIIDAIPTIVGLLIAALPEIITTIVTVLITNIPEILSAAVQVFMALVEAIPTVAVSLAASIPTLITTIVNGLAQGISSVTQVGTNLVKGIWNGIKNAKQWILDKIKGFGSSIVSGIKSIFKVKSPSKVMEDEVGIFVGQGVGTGIIKSLGSVMQNVETFGSTVTAGMSESISTNMQGLNTEISGTMNGTAAVGSSGTNTDLRTGGGVVVYQTNNYSKAHSRYELYKSKQQTAAAVRLALGGV